MKSKKCDLCVGDVDCIGPGSCGGPHIPSSRPGSLAQNVLLNKPAPSVNLLNRNKESHYDFKTRGKHDLLIF